MVRLLDSIQAMRPRLGATHPSLIPRPLLTRARNLEVFLELLLHMGAAMVKFFFLSADSSFSLRGVIATRRISRTPPPAGSFFVEAARVR